MAGQEQPCLSQESAHCCTVTITGIITATMTIITTNSITTIATSCQCKGRHGQPRGSQCLPLF